MTYFTGTDALASLRIASHIWHRQKQNLWVAKYSITTEGEIDEKVPKSSDRCKTDCGERATQDADNLRRDHHGDRK